MTTKDNNKVIPSTDSKTVERITELCKIILVNEDKLDKVKGEKYIKIHIDEDIRFTGDRYNIRYIVQKEVMQYIENCPSNAQLFAFASDSNFHIFRKSFKDYYYKYYYMQQQDISSLVYPVEFEYVFDFIQEAIDFHTLYEKFSIKMSEEAVKRAKREAVEASQDAANAATIAAQHAEKAANNAATKAVEQAIKQVNDEKIIENQVTISVDKEMNRVTAKISETSVTILGIFAGIVLTVVAGLFYSSSVIDNINAANFYRLISASALVGFVCFNLLALMFRYIERIRNSNESKTPFFSKVTLFVSITLLIIMIAFAVLQFHVPSDIAISNKEEKTFDVNVTIPQSEVSDETTDTKDVLESDAQNKENTSDKGNTQK